ncbi:hypothetical protein C8A01DRAFT_12623 [Parachaetomium inaequale]|uniref:Condensation domain-containing protein n=1 Tax=Parachaetomium inaequale TaxID=2588326 RepID=A0AAN6PNA7_9PEZI|nr:hypothetical protein C8A01DRAFT_12623 [Parachaetomium inaequale]
MAWTETQPGLWQRPIGENESMIKMIGDAGQASGKDVWSISATACFTASVDPKPLTQALRDGWAALRFLHPSIATTADGDTLHYHVPDAQQLTQWLDETFTVLHGEWSVDNILSTLPPRRLACCYYLEHSKEVVLHFSHWRTDGIGAFHLLGALFSATVEHLRDDPHQLPWGRETVRLVPSVEHALKLPTTPTESVNIAAKTYSNTVGHAKDALGIPLRPTEATEASRLPTFCFPADQTTQLLLACSQRGIRFESALHASVTAAAYSLAGPAMAASEHQHHTSTLRHSLRPHLPAPYDGVAGAAGLYTAGYFVKVPASQSWLDNARYYEAEYAKGATPDLLCSRRQYALEMKAIMSRVATAPPPSPPPSGLDMSWVPGAQDLVGTMYADSRDGRFVRVDKVGISVDVLSRHVYVFAWMFNGEIQCRLAFNRAFYDDGFADAVLELVAQQLKSNLLGESQVV